MARSPWWIERARLPELLERAGAVGRREPRRLGRPGDADQVRFRGGTDRESGGRRTLAPAARTRPPAVPPAVPEPAPDAAGPPTRPSGAPMAWQALPAIDPAAPVYDRLSAFCDWLLDVAGGVEMFVADGDGLPLATRGARDEHVAVSAAIDRSMRPILRSLSGDPHVSVVMETGEGELLEVLWVSTPAGRWAVGLVVPEALPRAATQTIRETLRSVCSVNERKIGCLAST